MDVEMPDCLARCLAQVDPDVETVGVVPVRDHLSHFGEQIPNAVPFLIRQLERGADMPVGNDEDVSRIDGILVEPGIGMRIACDNDRWVGIAEDALHGFHAG